MTLHPLAQAILGGIVAAITIAIPLVDDGTSASEVLSILLGGIVGTGLTAVKPPRKRGL